MKRSKIIGFIGLALLFILSVCAACVSSRRELNTQSSGEAATLNRSPLQVYLMGQANEISSSEEERIEYSLPVSVGLERTGYMPGYAQGNPIYQALLDYEEETGIDVEVSFFDTSVGLVEQMQEAVRVGEGPDLVLVIKQFGESKGINWQGLLDAGTFENLAPYLDLNAEQYYEKVLQSGVYAKQQYLVPFLFDLSGYITSEEFLRETGQSMPGPQSSYEELLNVFQEACLALQQNSSKLALYECTTVWEYYIADVLMAATGERNLEKQTEIPTETIVQILEVMHDFLDHNFQLIPGFEEKTLDENVNSMNSMYDRFNFGPLHSEDPEYKREMLGILLEGGWSGHFCSSSLIMQAYALQTYYNAMNEHMVLGGIPTLQEAGMYTAFVTALGFCPAGAANIEGAAQCMQYLLDYRYPLEIGISVNKDTVAEGLEALTQTETELYIAPRYDPFSNEEIRQATFDQSKETFEPMQEEVAQTLLALLDHIAGASLPYTIMEELKVYLADYYEGRLTAVETAEALSAWLNP